MNTKLKHYQGNKEPSNAKFAISMRALTSKNTNKTTI